MITFVGNVTLTVATSLVRSVDSVDVDSELEIGTVIATDSTLFVIEMRELAACAMVVENVADCVSIESVLNFGVVEVDVEVESDSCDLVDVYVDDDDDVDGDGDGVGCGVTSNDCY